MPTRVLSTVLLAGLALAASAAPLPDGTVRFATFNVSMYREQEGALRQDLADPSNAQARKAAAILQSVRPDVVLLNEFDRDADGAAADLFRTNFLAISQAGQPPLDYPYVFVAETNTGITSGLDLDGDGQVTTQPGSRGYGGDAFGYGTFPGQYGFVVLSRFPIEREGIRSFRLLRWLDVPGASIPPGFYPPGALQVLRLSSKNHVDIPIRIGTDVVHLLASHPTPPTFDGPEDRNGRRNADEIRFWSLYLDAPSGATWPVDDQGRHGGLGDAAFVIAGDLNSDPVDGDSRHDAIRALLDHPRVHRGIEPRSAGAVEQARLQDGVNAAQSADPALDTADFDDRSVGNLRLDYVLPSAGFEVAGSGVFWPESTAQGFEWVGTYPFPVSDHRLVWLDLGLPIRPAKEPR